MALSKKAVFAGAGVAMGLFALIATQLVTKERFEPIVAACVQAMSDPEAFDESKYHAYEPLVGGPWVCFITQFVEDLVKFSPIGLISFGVASLMILPMSVVSTIEAGRSGASGPLRYPTICMLLSFFFGGSVIFPALWLPSYIYGRCDGDPKGTVSLTRARMAVPIMLPLAVLSILAFILNSDTYAWTLTAGLLLGPAWPLSSLSLFFMSPPKTADAETVQHTTAVIAVSYAIAGVLALIGWVMIVFSGWVHYETDLTAVWKDLWTEAEPAVAFMTIDSIIIYLGLLTYLAYCRTMSALEALVLTPLFGPGAACALVMAQLEFDRADLKAKGD